MLVILIRLFFEMLLHHSDHMKRDVVAINILYTNYFHSECHIEIFEYSYTFIVFTFLQDNIPLSIFEFILEESCLIRKN